ncbi:hypothetical protein P3L10_021453 [Capsicum annuum]
MQRSELASFCFRWLRDVVLPSLVDLMHLMDMVLNRILSMAVVELGIIKLGLELGHRAVLSLELRMRANPKLLLMSKCRIRMIRRHHLQRQLLYLLLHCLQMQW